MNRKPNILAAFLALALVLMMTACGAGGDKVERFAEANPGSGENIAIPGYEKLSFEAGKTAQAVNLKNPAENATRITLTRALDAGEYPATIHYDCYTIEDNRPLNGAEIELIIEVK